MPVFFNAVIRVELKKDPEDPKNYRIEKFPPEAMDEIKNELAYLRGEIVVGLNLGEYSVETIEFIAPKKGLDKLWVPLPELRMAIANEMQTGTLKLPVTDLLELIRSVYRENRG